MRRRLSQSQRGVTLIELVLAVGISSMLVYLIASTMQSQQEASFSQLEYIEAQQNARASIAMLKNYVRGAGWGRPNQTETRGTAFLGSCFKTGDDRRKQDSCNAVDDDSDGNPGMDRIRVLGIEPVEQGAPSTILDPASPDNVMTAGTVFATILPLGWTHVAANNDFGVLAGTCGIAPGVVTQAMELVRMSPINPCVTGVDDETCAYNIAERIETDPCGGNLYNNGFAFGKARFADFFVDRSDPEHPSLKLRLNPDVAMADAHTVAWDIDDLQIEYGVDIGDPLSGDEAPDGLIDYWCDDLNSNTCAPEAYIGGVYEKQSRIIAVRIAVVTRSRVLDPERVGTPGDIEVFDHTYTGTNDGYRRWIYRTTIALRNNQR